ncbi:hypothetical protein [Mycobacterium sp. GA-1841]|nr:hypothetical protein [Mycobacterium sp. GA-1841]
MTGRAVLGQQIGILGYLGVALVTAASIGAVRSAPPRSNEPLG